MKYPTAAANANISATVALKHFLQMHSAAPIVATPARHATANLIFAAYKNGYAAKNIPIK